MSFAAIDLKILVMLDNYASYNMGIFGSQMRNICGRQPARVQVLRFTTFSPSPLLTLLLPH